MYEMKNIQNQTQIGEMKKLKTCHIFMFLLQSECFACIQIIKTVGDKNGIPVGMIMKMIKQSITLIPVIIKMVDNHVIYR